MNSQLARMVECEICFEEYQEGTLELHQGTCVLRLVFRCSICNEDYVSREGLGNHLDLHEILGGINESHYQELKAKYRLHQCTLCNDQRAYSESSYRIHVCNVHGNREIQVRNIEGCLKQSWREQSSEVSEGLHNRCFIELTADLNQTVGNSTRKESDLSTENLVGCKNIQHGFACVDCKRVFRFESLLSSHKKKCGKQQKPKCSICGKVFDSRKEKMSHYMKCKQMRWLCKLCGTLFKRLKAATRHNRLYHQRTSRSKTLQLVPNHDQKLETIVKETTISASDDRTPATVYLLSSRSNDGSTRDTCDKASIDSQASLKGSSQREVVTRKNALPFSCKGCDTSFYTQDQLSYHRVVKHTEPLFQCPKCSKMFHFKRAHKAHVADCGSKNHSCEICGLQFHFSSLKSLNHHKRKLHNVYSSSRKARGESEDCAEGIAQEMVICGTTFDSADGPMNNKPWFQLTFPKYTEESKESRLGQVEDHQINSMLLPQDDHVNMEIKVEEIQLQEQEFVIPKEYQGESCPTPLHSLDSAPNHAATDLENGIKIKEELLEEEEEHSTKHQSTTESLDRENKCLICGLSFEKLQTLNYHKIVKHTEPRYECSFCQKKFHFTNYLGRHTKACAEMQCPKCNIRFASRAQLDKHNRKKHGNKSKDDGEVPADNHRTVFQRLNPPPNIQCEASIRNEAGDLVWPCSVCKLSFKTKSVQYYHMTVTHTEKQHECSLCRKKFHIATQLRRHEKYCVETRCHECGVLFSSRCLLDKHNIEKHSDDDKPTEMEAKDTEALDKGIKIEDEEDSGTKSLECQNGSAMCQKSNKKTYPCAVCGRNFSRKPNMEYHRVTSHTEARLYCSCCQKMFHAPRQLRRHKCGTKFTSHAQLKDSEINKHSHADVSINVEAAGLKPEIKEERN